MKRKLIFAILAGFLFCHPAITFAQASSSERIISFGSYIKVADDASMTVTEAIKVRSAGDQIRHGIYRDFPTTYRDRLGNNYVVGFDVISVQRDSQPEGYHFENLSNGKRVYFGRKEVLLSPGEYTYTFTYKTNRQLGFFKDKDELYWNVTGNGWNFQIDKASATVELPAGAASQIIETTAYTGYQGAKGTDFQIGKDSSGNVTFATTRSLMPTEGLTIVVSWPKGFVSEPSAAQKVEYYVKDNRGVIFGLLGILVVLLYYLIIWYQHGKDPSKGTIIPLFHPARGLSPEGLRYIFKMGYDNKVFTAAIINMAVKGYLKIEEKREFFITIIYTLAKTGASESVLTKEESLLSVKLFGHANAITLRNENYQAVQAAIASLKRSLKSSFEKVYFLTNAAFFGIGILISVVIFFLTFNFLLGFFMVIINIVFYRLLKAPTLLGRKVMDEIEGFKMYLSVAEKDNLKLFNSPEKTPELFEKYLPYALALDVEQRWAEQFSDVFKRLKDTNQAYSPGWYSGPHWNAMAVGGFSSHLSSSLSQSISSSSSPPGSSSGGGGGGSSGGGGGGGGGGGW